MKSNLSADIIHRSSLDVQRHPPLKTRALLALIITLILAALAWPFWPSFGFYGLIPPALSTLATALLFYFEKPTPSREKHTPPRDPQNLY